MIWHEIEALAGRYTAAVSATAAAQNDIKPPTSYTSASAAAAAKGDADRTKAQQTRLQRALANLHDTQ
jgi:hypothetical protein